MVIFCSTCKWKTKWVHTHTHTHLWISPCMRDLCSLTLIHLCWALSSTLLFSSAVACKMFSCISNSLFPFPLTSFCISWSSSVTPVSSLRFTLWLLWLHLSLSQRRASVCACSSVSECLVLSAEVKTTMQWLHTLSPSRATCSSTARRRFSVKAELALMVIRNTCGPGEHRDTLLMISLFTSSDVSWALKSHHQPGVSTTVSHRPATMPSLREQVVLSLVTNSSLPRRKFPTELFPEFLPPRRTIFNCDV